MNGVSLGQISLLRVDCDIEWSSAIQALFNRSWYSRRVMGVTDGSLTLKQLLDITSNRRVHESRPAKSCTLVLSRIGGDSTKPLMCYAWINLRPGFIFCHNFYRLQTQARGGPRRKKIKLRFSKHAGFDELSLTNSV